MLFLAPGLLAVAGGKLEACPSLRGSFSSSASYGNWEKLFPALMALVTSFWFHPGLDRRGSDVNFAATTFAVYSWLGSVSSRGSVRSDMGSVKSWVPQLGPSGPLQWMLFLARGKPCTGLGSSLAAQTCSALGGTNGCVSNSCVSVVPAAVHPAGWASLSGPGTLSGFMKATFVFLPSSSFASTVILTQVLV